MVIRSDPVQGRFKVQENHVLTLIQYLWGALLLTLGSLGGLAYNSLKGRIDDVFDGLKVVPDTYVRREDFKQLELEVNQLPNVYVRRDDYSAAINRIESSTVRMEANLSAVLNRIEARLDKKADKE